MDSREDIGGFAWTNDGGIVYARGTQLLEKMADGRERVLLEAGSPVALPEVCRATGQIVFEWRSRNGSIGANLWRLSADGGDPYQLTDLPNVMRPVCSPDGQWVAFTAPTGLSRVRTGGGPVEMLDSAGPVDGPSWSPDSRAVAILASVPAADGGPVRKLLVISPGSPTRHLDAAADSSSGVTSTPDGSAVSYLARKGGAVSIHIHPLDGSAPRVMAASNDEVGAQVSPNGSKIAVLRTQTDSDVVLLRDGAAASSRNISAAVWLIAARPVPSRSFTEVGADDGFQLAESVVVGARHLAARRKRAGTSHCTLH